MTKQGNGPVSESRRTTPLLAELAQRFADLPHLDSPTWPPTDQPPDAVIYEETAAALGIRPDEPMPSRKQVQGL